MGFACFLCKKALQEIDYQQKGGGDADLAQYSASVIVKCGHLFHSICLKRYFDSQSTNAWAAKDCPVCKESVAIQDVIRVKAYPYDESTFQRRGIETLQREVTRLQQQVMNLNGEINGLRQEKAELKYNLEQKMRELEKAELTSEHFARAVKMRESDIETYKAEIEKLKNMVIKLTEKITNCERFPDGDSNIGITTVNRLSGPFGNDLHRFSATGGYELHAPQTNSGLSGSHMKSSSLPHPPGLPALMLYSMSQENVSGVSSPCSGPETLSSQRPIAMIETLNQQIKNLNMNLSGGNGHGQPGSHLSSVGASNNVPAHPGLPLYRRLPQESAAPERTDENQNCGGRIMPGLFDSTDIANAINGLEAPTVKATPVPSNTNVADTTSPGDVCGYNEAVKKVVESPKTAKNQFSSADAQESNNDDLFFDERESENWHEKKTRRRGSSRGTSNRNAQTHGRGEEKRYGYFKCSGCNCEWGSSKSILNKPQVCRNCKIEVHPYKQDFILPRKQLELKEAQKKK